MKIVQRLLQAFIFCFFISVVSLQAKTDINALKSNVLSILQKSNPQALPAFKEFFKQYDSVVIHFFDRSNNDSLATHITHMEKELKRMNETINDKNYQSVKTILLDLSHDLKDLIDTLKGYVDTSNSVFLAFSVRKFKFLLPTEVLERGEFSLYKSLHHRHNC